MVLTAKEIASRLASSDEEEKLLFDRIRHWTREGLLSPAGEKNPGTGRARLYDDSAVRKARALNSLTECGVTVRALHRISLFLDSEADAWLRKQWGPNDLVYLVIQKFRRIAERKMELIHLTRGPNFPELRFGKTIEYAIVVDLSEQTK
jgi:DNA-binding transcriptional MerR regulator